MKKIWFMVLLVAVFALAGCGGDDSGGNKEPLNGSSPPLQNGVITISSIEGAYLFPPGGPFSVVVSGIDNTVSAPANCAISSLVVTGTGNQLWFHGSVENIDISGIETIVHIRKDATPTIVEITGIDSKLLRDL